MSFIVKHVQKCSASLSIAVQPLLSCLTSKSLQKNTDVHQNQQD